MPEFLHNGHVTAPGRTFCRARRNAQRGPDHDNAGNRAVHETVARWLASTSRQRNRRREPRSLFVHPVVVEGSLAEMNQEFRVLATTLDISCGGVGLLAPRALPCDQVILHILDASVMAEVRWCKQLNARLFRAGVRFVKLRTT